jgi:hypothetical protein
MRPTFTLEHLEHGNFVTLSGLPSIPCNRIAARRR